MNDAPQQPDTQPAESNAQRDWGRWVLERSRAAGYRTQHDLARAVGCRYEQLSRWLQMTEPPRMRKGFDLALARALRITPQALFNGDASTSPSAAEPPQTIEAPLRLRVVNCRTCGCVFALPLSLYLSTGTACGSVYCPSGHLNEVRPVELEGEILPQLLLSLEECATARAMAGTMGRQLAALQLHAPPPVESLPIEELTRRSRFLENRAPATVKGKRECGFCNKLFVALSLHLVRNHAKQLAALPAERFEV